MLVAATVLLRGDSHIAFPDHSAVHFVGHRVVFAGILRADLSRSAAETKPDNILGRVRGVSDNDKIAEPRPDFQESIQKHCKAGEEVWKSKQTFSICFEMSCPK